MTIKEAYEIQRKEVWALRAENRRLQKQVTERYCQDEIAALNRHIRHLEQVIKTNDHRHESTRNNLRYFKTRCRDLEEEVISLQKRISRITIENEELLARAENAEAEVLMLNGTNKKLEKKVNMSFENSSLPSSALPFRKKIPNSRKPTGRKPGAQNGHVPHIATRLIPTTEPVRLPAPDEFLSNPDIYPTGKSIVKQFVDIQIQVHVQDYIAEEYRNRITGTRVHAAFPKGIVNQVNYGPSLRAFAFLLNNYYNVSISKTGQCISDLTRGLVKLSTGTISNLASAFSAATKRERAKIFSLLSHADVLYSDSTVSNVNGSRKAVILCTDKEHVLYQHMEHKGHKGLCQTPVNSCSGTIVHDHEKSYYHYGSEHQECLAHVLRYLISAIENEPNLTWHKQMHRLLQKIIHTVKHNKHSIPEERIRSLTDKYDTILSLASIEYSNFPPNKEFMDGFNLYRRLQTYKDAHLHFLSHPGVDYTNNISERELRKFKRKQKQAVVLRSDSGGQNICNALTIIETARLQNQNTYDVVLSAFGK